MKNRLGPVVICSIFYELRWRIKGKLTAIFKVQNLVSKIEKMLGVVLTHNDRSAHFTLNSQNDLAKSLSRNGV